MKEEVSASAKLGRDKALELAAAASRIVVAKGKRVTTFDLKRERPDPESLLEHMLGPTGNLRAPTIVRGKTVLVGFNNDEYESAL